MLVFQKIRFKNLLSYGESFTELDFQESTATLIIGENGVGKSALLDALTLGVFNKPFRKKLTKPQLISNINERDCVVEVLFETNNKQYKIHRSMKPNKFQIFERAIGNEVSFINWAPTDMLDQTVIGEQQKFLENNILKMNYTAFIQVVVLGKAKYQSFFELDMAHRRAMVEEMLSSTIFGQMNKLLKTKILITTNKISEISYHIDKLKTKIDLQKEHITELEKGNKLVVSDIENEITELDTKLNQLRSQQKELDHQHIHLMAEQKPFASSGKELRKITDIKTKLESKKTYLQKDIKFFEDNDQCPKCSQELSQLTKTKSINTLTIAIGSQIDKVGQVDIKILELQATLAKYEALVDRTNTIWTENSTITTTINSLDNQKTGCINKIDSLERTFDIKKSVNELLASNAEYNGLLDKKSLLLVEESVSLDLSKVLGDDGAKQLLIKKYIPIFNKYINFYLGKMGLNISFTLDENFNEKILARYRDKSTYYSFSEGEKLRIDLAMLLTWRTVSQLRNSVNTNLLILDEIFDSSLDVEGVEGFIESLNEFGEMNVIVVSHTPDKISKWAKRIIKAEKHGNFSMLTPINMEA